MRNIIAGVKKFFTKGVGSERNKINPSNKLKHVRGIPVAKYGTEGNEQLDYFSVARKKRRPKRRNFTKELGLKPKNHAESA